MLVGPGYFINPLKNKKYSELLVARDKLIDELKAFEKQPELPPNIIVEDGPDMEYLLKLEVLSKLCMLISDKYSKEYVRTRQAKLEEWIKNNMIND